MIKPKNKNNFRGVLIWLIVILAVFYFLNYYYKAAHPAKEISFTEFIQEVERGNVQNVTLTINEIKGEFKKTENNEMKTFRTISPYADQKPLVDILQKNNVVINTKAQNEAPLWFIISQYLPIILIILFFFMLIKQSNIGGGGSQAFTFGRSKAKLWSADKKKVTFKDVAGVDEAVEELKEVVDFLKAPQKYRDLGARIPKGVLLLGAPGTGKTLLGRAIAGEAGVPFFYISGSDFVEMFVGVGASVTGDTPVLIRDDNGTKLTLVGEFVDKFYQNNSEGFVVTVKNVKTLGFDKGQHGFWGYKSDKMLTFNKSAWKDVSGVFRHKAGEIYEIEYLGGKIKTTGDHSVFIRKSGRILPVEVRNLKEKDILVELPLNVRLQYQKSKKQQHKILAHQFSSIPSIELDIWNDDPEIIEKYNYVLDMKEIFSQYKIAQTVGVSQTAVSDWQRGIHMPQVLSKKLVKLNLPDKVTVTLELMKLLGFYTAEGRSTGNLEFVFGSHEEKLHQECTGLIKNVFGVEAVIEKTDTNSVRIKYYSHHLGRFFGRFCGNGSHNKHVPEFIWNLPKEYFMAYLEGYSKGDGYITKSGKLAASSVSRQLILELAWLCAMHGIRTGIKHEIIPGGRIIKDKSLPSSEAWSLIIGKTSNPFLEEFISSPNQFKRAIITKITKKKYDGFVYDLCGVENEAFFGGEKPVLFHNSRVRDTFEQAKKSSPCIVFIDEIDAVGRQRGAGLGGGHDEREQTLNQLLVEMDGFEINSGVILIAATNRPDVLDPALLRPGRFDRHIVVDKPDIAGRKFILEIHSREKPLNKDVDLSILARRTPGFSGADLENLLNEAALLAARNNEKTVTMKYCEESIDRVMMGPERKSRLINEKEKNITAYHEAGHALVAKLLPDAEPVRKVTILPRGMALGATWQMPEEDKYMKNKSELLAEVKVLLAGRVAEEIVFNEMTTGASNDLKVATDILRKMICKYGMSEKLGPITLGKSRDQVFLGRDMFESKDYSDDVARQIDLEIKQLVDQCYAESKRLLEGNKEKLEKLVERLKEKEVIEGSEIDEIINNGEKGSEKSEK